MSDKEVEDLGDSIVIRTFEQLGALPIHDRLKVTKYLEHSFGSERFDSELEIERDKDC